MSTPPSTPETSAHVEGPFDPSSERPASSPHHKMSARNRLLFFVTAWLIVLMPFLFWWNTWFGRQLSDKQITGYLQDDKRPRRIQHALVQLGERIGRHDAGAARWYPEIVRLASHSVEEVRNTDAWLMGQDPSVATFHETLLKMLGDSSSMVRGNAALSLVRFGDAAGRAQIVALLQPAHIVAPRTARVADTARAGTAIRQGGLLAKLQTAPPTPASQIAEIIMEVRSPISGRIHSINAPTGALVAAGAEIATVDPGDEQVWEALRALFLIGLPDDLPAIRPYERDLPEISSRIRQQALLTEKAILDRSASHP